MLKLLIAGLLLVAHGFQHADAPVSKTGQQGQDTHSGQGPTQPRPPAGDSKAGSSEPETQASKEGDLKAEHLHNESVMVHCTEALAFCGVAQLIAAAFQIGVYLRQAGLMETQGDVLAKQADMQAIAVKQWVEVSLAAIEDPATIEDPFSEERITRAFDIFIKVANRTQYPLTFQQAWVRIMVDDTFEAWNLDLSQDLRLIPGDLKSSHIGLKATAWLGKEALAQRYSETGIQFTILGTVQFISALGEIEIQPFGFRGQPASTNAAEIPLVFEMKAER